MHLTEAHRISNGVKTLVAVIDSGIDSKQPEIADTNTESFDAIDGGNGEKATPGTEVHGTEVAGISLPTPDSQGSRRKRTSSRSGLSPKAAAGPQWLARPKIFWLGPNGR
jgi:subtilisin family serine protease